MLQGGSWIEQKTLDMETSDSTLSCPSAMTVWVALVKPRDLSTVGFPSVKWDDAMSSDHST